MDECGIAGLNPQGRVVNFLGSEVQRENLGRLRSIGRHMRRSVPFESAYLKKVGRLEMLDNLADGSQFLLGDVSIMIGVGRIQNCLLDTVGHKFRQLDFRDDLGLPLFQFVFQMPKHRFDKSPPFQQEENSFQPGSFHIPVR